jgi:2-hydroxychromene-2-carboxylate isomerase
MHIDYYFTLNSPWVYLAGDRLDRIAARHGASVAVKPVEIGAVFSQTGGLPLKQRSPARQAYRMQELRRWKAFTGLPIVLEPRFWPADVARASAAIAAVQAAGGDALGLSRAFSTAIFEQERDVADPATFDAITGRYGLDATALERGATAFAANTAEALARGVFGSPSYVVGDEVFWGQDRLDMLDWHLGRLAAGI